MGMGRGQRTIRCQRDSGGTKGVQRDTERYQSGEAQSCHCAQYEREAKEGYRVKDEWIVVQPGGPSGPFYSIVASSGQVIALQVPDGKNAGQIARIPANDAQDERLVDGLREIRDSLLAGNEKMDAVRDLNFWISVYDQDGDGL
jgi:hypothetical protein